MVHFGRFLQQACHQDAYPELGRCLQLKHLIAHLILTGQREIIERE